MSATWPSRPTRRSASRRSMHWCAWRCGPRRRAATACCMAAVRTPAPRRWPMSPGRCTASRCGICTGAWKRCSASTAGRAACAICVRSTKRREQIATGSAATLLADARALPGQDQEHVTAVETEVLRRFAWSDGVSAHLSDTYRGGMTASFLLGALAIVGGITYLPFHDPGHKWIFALFELWCWPPSWPSRWWARSAAGTAAGSRRGAWPSTCGMRPSCCCWAWRARRAAGRWARRPPGPSGTRGTCCASWGCRGWR